MIVQVSSSSSGRLPSILRFDYYYSYYYCSSYYYYYYHDFYQRLLLFAHAKLDRFGVDPTACKVQAAPLLEAAVVHELGASVPQAVVFCCPRIEPLCGAGECESLLGFVFCDLCVLFRCQYILCLYKVSLIVLSAF